jgi:spore coat polysaccharide biosynthesis protein SpsF
MGSTRLPGKVLKEIEKETVLDIHFQRVGKAKLIDEIILTTSINPENDPIAAAGEKSGIRVYRGSENDVLDRYYRAAEMSDADVVVRVTSDCPLIDGEVIDKIVQAHLDHCKDFTSNIVTRTYPDGMDVEVFDFATLKRAWVEAISVADREHVTYYMWQNSDLLGKDLFSGYNVIAENELNYSNIRLTLDYNSDFELLSELIRSLGTKKSWLEYVKYIIENPEIQKNNL